MRRPRFSAYWTFALLAVLHCIIIWGLAFGSALETEWKLRLWVGLFTLWPFWLVVLLFHRERKLWPAVVSITLSVLLLFPLLGWYDFMAGEKVFGWPRGLSIEPFTAVTWTRAYLAGRAEAKNDLQNGRLVIEEYGFGAGSGNRFRILRDRYGIELNAKAQCLVDAKILAYAEGYNSVSQPEINRRYGPTAIKTAFEEGYRLDVEEVGRRKKNAEGAARTFSSNQPGDKVVLASITLYDDNEQTQTDTGGSEKETVSSVVRWVTAELNSVLPADAADFDTHISVELKANNRPELSISSSASMPRAAHMAVYDKRHNLPDFRSERPCLTVTMHFQSRRHP